MKAIRLETSGLTHALGIDDRHPRFHWNCEGGLRQTAYRVVLNLEDEKLLYDSGKREGNEMFFVYPNNDLRSRMIVTWRVCLWDEEGRTEWSDPASFEMGLLDAEDWQAKWICGIGTDRKEHLPADCYRKRICLSEPVKKVRLYATALGVYTAQINGRRVSSILAPGSTEYEKTLYYQTYDVTAACTQAECELLFTVADGWYKGKLGADQYEYLFGTQTKLMAQLEIEYISGRKECFGTDDSFEWSNDGPVRFADLKDGEIYDARMQPSFSDHAALASEETRIPTASNAPAIMEHEHFPAVLERSPSGKSILNFGQNIAGYVKFRTKAPRGTQIRICLFEAKDHGEYSNTSLSFPDGKVEPVKQEIFYTASGNEAVYCPSFFYSGFQYALVEGLDSVHAEDFEAVSVYSDLSYNGSFSCSDERINRFVRNTIWSMKSNFIDVPTDCPQREKSGWTGDAQVFCKTALWFADPAAFFRKWLRDVRDCQRENGMVVNVNPCVLPAGTPMDFVNGSCGWADAAVIIPYTLWKWYDDKNIIRENYDLMHCWKTYVMDLCANKSMFSLTESDPMFPMKPLYDAFRLPDSEWNRYIPEYGIHWGEWSVPQSQEPSELDPASALIRPKQEVTCAYTYASMKMLSEMLFAIDLTEEAEECTAFADGCRKAYHTHWIKNGTVESNHMAEMVRPIALGLVDEKEKSQIAAALNQMVVQRQYKVGTGFLSTPFLLQALAENNYLDSAYKMLENEKAPGWLAMISQGATTVWEEYVCYDQNGSPLPRSFNHYSLGAVCGFLFDTVCGIHISGSRRFDIAPKPGGSLQSACACSVTAYGEIKSQWQKCGDQVTFVVEIPANTSALIHLPNGREESVEAGIHTFIC